MYKVNACILEFVLLMDQFWTSKEAKCTKSIAITLDCGRLETVKV